VDKKERDRGWRWEWHGGYERLWEIRSTTCLIVFRIPCISVIISRIRTGTCRIGDGQFTLTWNSLKSVVLMMISPISSDLSLCCAQLYHHQLTPSTAYTMYSIHQVQHHPKIDSLPLPASFSSLGGCCCTRLSTFAQFQMNQSFVVRWGVLE